MYLPIIGPTLGQGGSKFKFTMKGYSICWSMSQHRIMTSLTFVLEQSLVVDVKLQAHPSPMCEKQPNWYSKRYQESIVDGVRFQPGQCFPVQHVSRMQNHDARP